MTAEQLEELLGSNTAMTMPVKIWASKDDIFDRYLDHPSDDSHAWVRADIAEELARALEPLVQFMEVVRGADCAEARAALARYNEATQ